MLPLVYVVVLLAASLSAQLSSSSCLAPFYPFPTQNKAGAGHLSAILLLVLLLLLRRLHTMFLQILLVLLPASAVAFFLSMSLLEARRVNI